MPRLLGIEIQNYKCLHHIVLGKVGYDKGNDLPALMCFVGPNGCGKSTLLDAFGFLADSLEHGVEAACDQPQRGGFSKLRTQGTTEAITFSLYFRESATSRPITYSFSIEESSGVPIVGYERLTQRRKGQKWGRPFSFLNLERGCGQVWSGQATEDREGSERIEVTLDDPGRLAIASLGQFTDHPRIIALRSYIQDWYLSYFIPDAARRLPVTGAQKHLNRTGENLANVVQWFERVHHNRFETILHRISDGIPGVKRISTESSPDGRLLLRFDEQGYRDPFYQPAMSDGTLKMFAYLLLLQDPEPRSFIGIEEPENGMYHKLLEQLARELRIHAERNRKTTQILVTTHSPYFVNALHPDQVWLLQKSEDGHTEATRAADMQSIKELVEEGIPLGSLWYSNHFEERHLF